MIDYEAKFVIIAGSQYSGEIKKSVFSVMNYIMPVEDNVLPMHCSANMDPDTHETAVFSDFQVRERPPSAQILTENLSATTSMAGEMTAYLTSRADALQSA